jgi:hypothetical protein
MIMAKSDAIYIARTLIGSKAFNSISAACYRVYFRFLKKRWMKPVNSKKGRKDNFFIANNGKIVFTYAEAKKELGMPPSTFMKSIDKLIEVGLIDVIHSGSGGRSPDGLHGDVSLYAISDRWQKYGTPDFEIKTRPKDTRCGRGFAAHPENRCNRRKN